MSEAGTTLRCEPSSSVSSVCQLEGHSADRCVCSMKVLVYSWRKTRALLVTREWTVPSTPMAFRLETGATSVAIAVERQDLLEISDIQALQ
jgi:hypothetical protein